MLLKKDNQSSRDMEHVPLVTFVLFAYNQDQYVREAVVGALTQTYSPLEIIISDDHSPDKTFEIMQEMADAYEGPHQIILNRNEKNLGIGSHVNKVMNMANGELIVIAAGDDVSLPERAEKLVKTWCEAGQPSGICSGVAVINDTGDIIDGGDAKLHFDGVQKGLIPPHLILHEYLKNTRYWLTGCAVAWSKKSWGVFGSMNPKVGNEDMVLSFRAGLIGGYYIMDDQLVCYRKHDENISFANKSVRKRSFRESASKAVKHVDRVYQLYLANKADLEVAMHLNGHEASADAQLLDYMDEQLERLDVARGWWGYSVIKKIHCWSCSPFESTPLRVISLFGEKAYRFVLYAAHQYKYFVHAYMK